MIKIDKDKILMAALSAASILAITLVTGLMALSWVGVCSNFKVDPLKFIVEKIKSLSLPPVNLRPIQCMFFALSLVIFAAIGLIMCLLCSSPKNNKNKEYSSSEFFKSGHAHQL